MKNFDVLARGAAFGFILCVGACVSGLSTEPGYKVSEAKAEYYKAAFNVPRGKVRLSQVGTRPGFPITAVAETDVDIPTKWTLAKKDGTPLQTGLTMPFGYDVGSGAKVHQIEITPIAKPMSGLVLVVDDVDVSHPFSVRGDVFNQLKYDLLNYYYQNRIGVTIIAELAGGEQWARPAGHVSEKLSCFEGEDTNGVFWPGCDYTLDVSKGWYDAGDHSKYVVNSGITVWTLQNVVEQGMRGFEDGRVRVPERGNGLNDLLDEARWNLDFMMGMQAPEGARASISRGDFSADPSKLIVSVADVSGMAHHKAGDAVWPTLPLSPDKNDTPRVLHAPSVTATLNLAATTAQCARLYKGIDDTYAAKCARAAKRAFAAAKRVPNAYSYNNFDGSGPYNSVDPRNEFYWAAAEMYVSFGDAYKADLLDAQSKLSEFPMSGSREMGWGDTQGLGTLTLANSSPDAGIRRDAMAAMKEVAEAYLSQRSEQGYAIAFSKEKWSWGSMGELANRGIVLANVYNFTGDTRFRDAALDMLDYILGRNPRELSYVSGYGTNAVEAMHHRFWAGAEYKGYPFPPPGVVSGGPNNRQIAGPVSSTIIDNCHAQTCFADVIDAYELNETCINWQAAVFWLAAWADDTDR